MEAVSRSMAGGSRGSVFRGFRHADAHCLHASQIRSRPQGCSRLVTSMAQQAAPAQLTVKTTDGSDAGTASLSLRVADPQKAKGLVHRHVVTIMQNARQGSANTKTRAEVKGGGRKPFNQKGTGNARQGSIRSPLKPGGGVIFGPKPKDYTIRMNKKERRLALATALQSAAGSITVVDDIKSKITEFKTKTLVDTISGLGFDVTKEHILLVVDELTEEIARSGRNIANLVFNEASSLNTYDILRADRILMDQASLTYISEFYGEKSAAA